MIRKAEIIFIALLAIYSIMVTYKWSNVKQQLNDRSVRHIHMIDSLSGVNAERQNQIDKLKGQLKTAENEYQKTLNQIDSLDDLGLRKQMRKLLTELTEE
jgi:peptidoglycan hydrolase CwlO-like protein